ncbi:MAG: glycoside hydrolase [Candidatus Hydrogenedentes bacterium]|nr:glycoside hydrolase [Candidatus Hydrogenedentota bacterium]
MNGPIKILGRRRQRRIDLQLIGFVVCLSALLAHGGFAEDAPLRVFENVHVVPLPVKTYGYRSMPGDIVELRDGRLLLGYTRYDAEGNADGAVAGRYSEDRGKTWGEEFPLVPAPTPKGPDIYCHPSFLRLPNDQILMSYIYRSSMKPLFGHTYYRRTADETATWGDQLIVTPSSGYHIVHNNKLLLLSSGRIIVPVEYQRRTEGGDHSGYVSYCMYSDDNGYTWWRSDNEVSLLPVETQEPHVVELRDGRLMMLMRTYSGFVARAFSSDQGKSWSEGEMVDDLPLPPHNTSALNVTRIPSTGDLLLIRCTGGPPDPRWRTPMASAISRDDGVTWEQERVVMGDPEEDYGYPSVTYVDDLALVSFHKRDGLHVARIGIDWFYGNETGNGG